MHDQPVPVTAMSPAEVFGPLEAGERPLWRGRAGVAEYAFDQAASLPRWTLPETTDILVTDRRVIYAFAADDGEQAVTSGELRWLWPQYLRLQPGARSTDRGAAASQIQLVCGGSDGSYPALVLAGGELRTVGDADRLANVLRQAIARFRVDNAAQLGLSTAQTRILSRLLIGPEFINHQGGDGQTVPLLGAMPVQRRSTPAAEPEPAGREQTASGQAAPGPATPEQTAPGQPTPGQTAPGKPAMGQVGREQTAAEQAGQGWTAPGQIGQEQAGQQKTEPAPAWAESVPQRAELAPEQHEEAEPKRRPGVDADASRAWAAARAERATQQDQPAVAERAADLAARVANLVAARDELGPEPITTDQPDPYRLEVPTTNLTERAEAMRRTAARIAANSAAGRATARREPGMTTRGRSA